MLVFDTSAYINAWRYHYPPTTFPSVWDLIGTAMDDGRIIAPREVYNELSEKDDDVFAWVRSRARRFVEPSEAVQRAVGPIQAMYDSTSVRDRADPFVIAEAKVRGFTVVTYEGTNTFTGRRTKNWEQKMPGLCTRLDIDCRIVPEALTMMGASI